TLEPHTAGFARHSIVDSTRFDILSRALATGSRGSILKNVVSLLAGSVTLPILGIATSAQSQDGKCAPDLVSRCLISSSQCVAAEGQACIKMQNHPCTARSCNCLPGMF